MFWLMMRAMLIMWLMLIGLIAGLKVFQPPVSPDGQLVYVVSLFSKLQLYQSDLSHELTNRLHTSESNDFQPTVSPLNGDIVFVSDRDGDAELYMLSSSGHQFRQLTDNDHDDLYPQWSPDGSQILYQSNPTGLSQFFVLSADGTSLQQLTDINQPIARPSWSPDGTQIAYDAGGEIYIYTLATAQSHQLTDDSAWDQHPSWSPDGEVIIYESNRGRNWHLYRIMASGGDPLAVSLPDRTDQHVTWTDTQQQIIFQSTRQFPGRLYSLHLEQPTQIDEVFVPPESGSSLYLLFGITDVLEVDWTDIIEPVWVRRTAEPPQS